MLHVASKKFVRFSAFLVAAVFLIQSAAPAQTLPKIQNVPLENTALFSIPTELGSVIENKTLSADQPFLIHIQDAHANYSAQKNTAKIIEHLAREQKIKTVFVEGAIGELDARYLKFSEDRKLNRKVADRLAQMGEMTAADLYLFDHPSGVEFIGIENVDLYRENLDLFKKVMNREAESRAWIQSEENRLERDLSRSVNKDLLAALRIYLHQEKNTASLMKVLSTLQTLSERHLNRDLRDTEEQKDFPNLVRLIRLKSEKENTDSAKVAAEIEQIEKLGIQVDFSKDNPRFEAERLYAALRAKGFEFSKHPNFTRYVKRLIYEKELDSTGLFDELDHWLELLMNRLAITPEEKQALHQVKQAKLTAKLLVLELNRKDWAEVKNQKPTVQTASAFAFYEKAERREAAFFEIIQKTLKSKSQNRAIVISGGFHTEALKKYFSDSKINYSVIMPGVAGDSRTNYVKTLLGRKAEDITESDLGSVPQAEPPALAAQLGIDVSGRQAVIAKAKSLGSDNEVNPAGGEVIVDENGWELPEGYEAVIHAGDEYFYVGPTNVSLLDKNDQRPVKRISFKRSAKLSEEKYWATDSENLELLKKYFEWKKIGDKILLNKPYGQKGGANGGMYLVNVKDPQTAPVEAVLENIKPGDVSPVVVKFGNDKEIINKRAIVFSMLTKYRAKVRDFIAETRKADKTVLRELNIDEDKVDAEGVYVQQPLVILFDLIRESKDLNEQKKLIDRFDALAESFWAAGFMDGDLRFDNCGFDKQGSLVIHDFDYTMTMEDFQSSETYVKTQMLTNYIINNAATLESINPVLRDYFLGKVKAKPFLKQILEESEREFVGWTRARAEGSLRKPFEDYVVEDAAQVQKSSLLTLVKWLSSKHQEQRKLVSDKKRAEEKNEKNKAAELASRLAALNREIALSCHYFFESSVDRRETSLAQLFVAAKRTSLKQTGQFKLSEGRALFSARWENDYLNPYKGYAENVERYNALEFELGDWVSLEVLKKWGTREEEELNALIELRERLGLVNGQQVFVGKKTPRFQMLDQNPTLRDHHFVVIKTDDDKIFVMDLDALEGKPSVTRIYEAALLGEKAYRTKFMEDEDPSIPLALIDAESIRQAAPDPGKTVGGLSARFRSVAVEDDGLGWLNDYEEDLKGPTSVNSISFADWAASVKSVPRASVPAAVSEDPAPSVRWLSSNPIQSVSPSNPNENNPFVKTILEKLEESPAKIIFTSPERKTNYHNLLIDGLMKLPAEWTRSTSGLDITFPSSGVVRIVYTRKKFDAEERVFEGQEFSARNERWEWKQIFIQVHGDAGIGHVTRRVVRPIKVAGNNTWELVEGQSLGFDEGRDRAEEELAQKFREEIYSAGALANELIHLTSDDVEVRIRALRQVDFYAQRNPKALSAENLKTVLGYLIFAKPGKPQPVRKEKNRVVRRTARTVMEKFGAANPAAFTQDNRDYLESLPLTHGTQGDDRYNLLAIFRGFQKKAQIQGSSLGLSVKFETQRSFELKPAEKTIFLPEETSEFSLRSADAQATIKFGRDNQGNPDVSIFGPVQDSTPWVSIPAGKEIKVGYSAVSKKVIVGDQMDDLYLTLRLAPDGRKVEVFYAAPAGKISVLIQYNSLRSYIDGVAQSVSLRLKRAKNVSDIQIEQEVKKVIEELKKYRDGKIKQRIVWGWETPQDPDNYEKEERARPIHRSAYVFESVFDPKQKLVYELDTRGRFTRSNFIANFWSKTKDFFFNVYEILGGKITFPDDADRKLREDVDQKAPEVDSVIKENLRFVVKEITLSVQERLKAKASSLGQTTNFKTQLDRVTDPEVIIHVAIEAADHLLYQGDLTQEGWLNRVLGIAQRAQAPAMDMPLDYVLAKLGLPAQPLKRRAVVVTQDLVKNPDVRAAILEGLKKNDRVIAVKNPILETEKYYDQFLKAARARGIEVSPFTNVSGIRADELERRLKNVQESFSAETAADPNSIPKINKRNFSRFKLDESALQRGNVSMKLTMEIIMALAAVDEKSVYQNAKFRLKEDGFWHVDNSFAEFMQSLFQEYQADETRKKAA